MGLIMGMKLIKKQKSKHWLEKFRVDYLKRQNKKNINQTHTKRTCVQQYELNEFNILQQGNNSFRLQRRIKCNMKPGLWLHSSNIQQHFISKGSEKERER